MVQIRHPTYAETCMWRKRLAAMLAIYTGKGVTPKECISHMPLQSVNKAAHSGFETQKRRHQKSVTRVSVAPKMDICPIKLKEKTIRQKLGCTVSWHIHTCYLVNFHVDREVQ